MWWSQVSVRPAVMTAAVVPSDSAPASQSAAAPLSIRIYLSSSRFVLSWVLVLLLHILLGSYALSVTAVHRYLLDPAPSDAVAGTNVLRQTLQITAQSFFLVALAHFVSIVRMIFHSIKAKQLVLHSPQSANRAVRPTPSPRSISHYLKIVLDGITTTWDRVFSGTGYFALSGPHFEVIFTIREAVEILLQTYQAYHLSRSVPRRWINHLAVVSIVLNCVASPLVHWLYKLEEAKRRLVNLLHDAVLDFCCAVVIPFGIVLPYALVYDSQTQSFPIRLIMNDVWYVNAISEGRQVLVTSFLDFISTIVPHIGLFTSLWTVKKVLRRQASMIPDANPSPATSQQINSSPTDPLPDKPVRAKRLRHDGRNREYIHRWLRFVVHFGFLAWGVFVVVLHLDAQYNTSRSVPGCKLFVNAWFRTGFPCSVLLVNCHMQRINGTTSEIASVLAQLERPSLQTLIFSHCPALEIPPVVTEFPHLGGLEVFNSSLVDWPADAAVRRQTHDRLSYVYFGLTNWTTFPSGLLHRELPDSLAHFVVVGNNLTELPESMGEVWEAHLWLTMAFERVPGLQQLPTSFWKLRMSVLELSNTGITGFPPGCFANSRAERLVVSGSPVGNLPELEGSAISTFYAENTAITELPSWFEGWMDQASAVSFYGSPACNTSKLRAENELWESVCSTDWNTTTGFHPLEIMVRLRPYEPQHVEEIRS